MSSSSETILLDHLDEYLDTYSGRDKFLKALCYSLKFATGFTDSSKNLNDLKLVSSEISNCRTILRFLDYVSVAKYVHSYKFGKNVSTLYIMYLNQPFFNFICQNQSITLVFSSFFFLYLGER